MTTKLIIIGAGGAAAEALWVCRRLNDDGAAPRFDVVGFADDHPEHCGAIVEGLPILGTTKWVAQRFGAQAMHFHCAIGDNRARQRICLELEAAGLLGIALIDPTAVVAPTATIGAGSYVGPLSVVAPHARVGRHVLINTQVSVGHHAVVSDFVQLCPGCRLSGYCDVGVGGFIGSNAVATPSVRIGAWATLGATSFALKTVPEAATAVGNPARVFLQ